MKIIYRTSDAGYNKVKPRYVNNINCLNNFVTNFGEPDLIICDNVSNNEHLEQINKLKSMVLHTNIGSGAGTFKYMLEYIINNYQSSDIVYMVENDYLHKKNSKEVLLSGFELGADYVSLYDHPDKYLHRDFGGNPQVDDGGEITRVLLGKYSHWKLTNSTTMTFASKVETLKQDYEVISKYISGTYPRDYEMFLELRSIGRSLITPLPGYSTHGETKWLSPFRNWEEVINNK